MKKFLFISFLSCLLTTQAISQNFLYHYNDPSNLVGPDYDGFLSFSCITPKEDHLLIAGYRKAIPMNPGPEDHIYYNLILVEVDQGGNIIDKIILTPNYEDPNKIVPTGIIYEHGISTEHPYVIVSGFHGFDGHNRNAFVLKYNLTTGGALTGGNVDWYKSLETHASAFLDLEKSSYGLSGAIPSFYMSGEILDPMEAEEAVVYKINKPGTSITKIIQSQQHDRVCSDTYFAMYKEPTSLVLSSRFELDNDNFTGMRPGLTFTSLSGTINNSYYYIKNGPPANARLYGLDVTKTSGGYLSIVTGDLSGTNLYEETFLIKTNTTGNYIYEKAISTNPYKNQFHSVKVPPYTEGALVSCYIYGSINESGALKDATLTSVSWNGSLNWWSKYDQIYVNEPSSPNSMIIFNDKIYAVGWYPDDNGYEEGALLCVALSNHDVNDCDDDNTLVYENDLEVQNDLPLEDAGTFVGFSDIISTVYTPELAVYDPCSIAFEKHIPGEVKIINSEIINVFNRSEKYVVLQLENASFDENYSIRIYDMSGRLLSDQPIENDGTVELSLPSGCYVYQLMKNSGTILSKAFVSM